MEIVGWIFVAIVVIAVLAVMVSVLLAIPELRRYTRIRQM